MDNERAMSCTRFTLPLLTAIAALAMGCGDSGSRPMDGGGTDSGADTGSGPDEGDMDAGDTDDGGGMDAGMDGGGGDAGTDGAVGMDGATDAMPIDAAGLTEDGGILSCVGAELPTTAVDPLTVGGTVTSIGVSGMDPLDDALLEVFDSSDSLLASTTVEAFADRLTTTLVLP